MHNFDERKSNRALKIQKTPSVHLRMYCLFSCTSLLNKCVMFHNQRATVTSCCQHINYHIA